jgi:hypothetical protein
MFRLALANTLARAEVGRLPTELEANIQSASNTLMFPFMQLSRGPDWLQVLGGFLPFTITSLLWGGVLYGAYHGAKQLVRHIRRPKRDRAY